MRRLSILVLILALFICAAEHKEYKLGTGSETGVYFQLGKGLAGLSSNVVIKPVISEGSVENINMVLKGEFGFGIAQSDRQYQAYYGFEDWQEAGEQKSLRSICSFYPETVTLMASEASGIVSVYDLKDKRISLGEKGSGQHQNALDVLSIIGCDLSDIQPRFLSPQEASKALEDGKIDAFFYTIGHPNNLVQQITESKTKMRFIPIVGYDAEKLLMDYPYYSEADIPAGLYPEALNKESVQSIGVRATLVTSADVPNEVVKQFTKSIFENFDQLKKIHPALQDLTKEEMFQALSAPMHDGAMEYYREVDLKLE